MIENCNLRILFIYIYDIIKHTIRSINLYLGEYIYIVSSELLVENCLILILIFFNLLFNSYVPFLTISRNVVILFTRAIILRSIIFLFYAFVGKNFESTVNDHMHAFAHVSRFLSIAAKTKSYIISPVCIIITPAVLSKVSCNLENKNGFNDSKYL